MISNGINPVQSPAQSIAFRPFPADRAHARNAEAPVADSVAVPNNSSQPSPAAIDAARTTSNPSVSPNLTAAPSPITDGAQAAAATQHARLLLQAQPRLALVAQANSSSQSVARLLQ